ncbi:hypothetical protein RhiJN_25275 [Ceratobasidium sp. AG-Ba]|nr:hypothetical protein RhiJN_25275 [Ceratobasidium sp. AG-Ba]
MSTAFTRRAGTYKFPETTPTNGYSSLVNNWHKNNYNRQDVYYQFVNSGTDHNAEWKAIPTILGEEHPQYSGRGSTKPKAQAASAEKIAKSGYC